MQIQKGVRKMKFKIGDKVKIINHDSKFYGFIGTVVKILQSIPDYYMLCFCDYYYDKFTSNYGPYSAGELKLASKNDMVEHRNRILAIEPLSDADQDGDTTWHKILLNTVYGMTGGYERGGFTHMVHKNNIPEIRNVYFNNPLTVVIWKDGTKTIVKNVDDFYDPEKGLAMAISKKTLGNKYNCYKEFKKWLPEEKEKTSIKCKEKTEIALTKNPVEKAYLILSKVNNDPTSKTDDFTAAIEEAIGYLGEALDD